MAGRWVSHIGNQKVNEPSTKTVCTLIHRTTNGMPSNVIVYIPQFVSKKGQLNVRLNSIRPSIIVYSALMCLKRTNPSTFDESHTVTIEDRILSHVDPNGFVETRLNVSTLMLEHDQPSFDAYEQVCHTYDTFPVTCFQSSKRTKDFLTQTTSIMDRLGKSQAVYVENTFGVRDCTSVVETIQTPDHKIVEFRRDWRRLAREEAETKCSSLIIDTHVERGNYALFNPTDELETRLFTHDHMTTMLSSENIIKPCFLPPTDVEIDYWHHNQTACDDDDQCKRPFICARTLRPSLDYKKSISLTPGVSVPFIPSLFDLTMENNGETDLTDPVVISFFVGNETHMELRQITANTLSSAINQLKTYRNLENVNNLFTDGFDGFDPIDFDKKYEMKVTGLPETSNLTLTMWIDHCPETYRFVDGTCYPKHKFKFNWNEAYTVDSIKQVIVDSLDNFEVNFRVHLPDLQTAVITQKEPLIQLKSDDILGISLDIESKGTGEITLFYTNSGLVFVSC